MESRVWHVSLLVSGSVARDERDSQICKLTSWKCEFGTQLDFSVSQSQVGNATQLFSNTSWKREFGTQLDFSLSQSQDVKRTRHTTNLYSKIEAGPLKKKRHSHLLNNSMKTRE